MINLLPPKGKRTVSRIYWLRTGTVWCLLAAGVLTAAWTILIPTHVLLSTQLSALASEEAVLRDQNESDHVEEAISEANQLATLLLQEEAAPSVSSVIDAVNSVAAGGITLRTFIVERSGTRVEEAQVQGIASSRSTLLAFKSALEQSDLIASADIPVSDLVNDRDIPFVFTINIASDAYDQ